MSAPNELHLAVAAALDAGLAVIPPMQNGTKRPIDLWKDYQTTAPSREQVREWYGREGYLGLGVLTGVVSGIEMLELEGRAIDEGLLLGLIELAETTGLGELVARIEAGYTETTPSGGLHWLYRVDPPLGNTKLASRPATAGELEANPADRIKVLIETRGEGGFVITAPSNGSVHPSGGRWTLTEGGFATIATITAGERDALFDLARAFDRMPKSDHRRPAGPTGSDRPGDRYNAAADAQGLTLDVLLRHGWTQVYSRNGVDYLRRPGKPAPGISATLGHVAPGVLHVFSTSTEFEVGAHDPFGVYTILEHDSDFVAAARALEPPIEIHGIPKARPRPDWVPGTEPDADPADDRRADRFGFTPVNDFLAELDEDEEWLVADIIPVGSLFQYLGKPESFKSMALQGLHVALRYGSTWLGRTVRPMPSYYISNEKRRRSIRERLRLMSQAQTVPARFDLTVIHRTQLRIHTANEGWLRLVDRVDRLNEHALISLDTITSLAPAGFKENTGESWAPVLDAIRMLTSLAYPATVLASFHPAKADGGGVSMSARGHGSFDGEADGALTFNRPSRSVDEGQIHARPKDGDYRVIPFVWERDTRLLVAKDLTGLALTADTMLGVLEALGVPVTWQEIQTAYGKELDGRPRFSDERIAKVLQALVEAGRVAKVRETANRPYLYSIAEEDE